MTFEVFSSWVTYVAPLRLFVMGLTAISCMLVGIAVVWTRRKVFTGERWLAFFGLGFLAFSMQYLGAIAYSLAGPPAFSAIVAELLLWLCNSAASLLFL
ncbi:MAG TPA: hypothetical protein VN970_10660, partial [Thermoanaerobaculia bacterium]|nr:hypothetical protein [Thermoanaerobaculia bacterium]